MTEAVYELVTLKNGTRSIRSQREAETFHPVLGPAEEARVLYVDQLQLRERLAQSREEFVIWDIGLGGGGNVFTVLGATRDLPCPIRIHSFDHTLEPLTFALEHASALNYLHHYPDCVRDLPSARKVTFEDGERPVHWSVTVADFPTWLESKAAAEIPPPHAILFDAYSPARNPAMWTLPLFEGLHRHLDPARPCSMATYSRSTLVRATWLLAGFFVGQGRAIAEKEETTVAANTLDLIQQPLGPAWLGKAQRSRSAEPLGDATYRQAALTPETEARLAAHPQFTTQTSQA